MVGWLHLLLLRLHKSEDIADRHMGSMYPTWRMREHVSEQAMVCGLSYAAQECEKLKAGNFSHFNLWIDVFGPI